MKGCKKCFDPIRHQRTVRTAHIEHFHRALGQHPAYRNEPGRVFSMRFRSLDVKFHVEGDLLTVVGWEKA